MSSLKEVLFLIMMFSDYFSMLRFAKPHRKLFALAVFFMIFTALFDCVSIGMILPLTDRVMIGEEMTFPNKLPAFAQQAIDYINNFPRGRLLYLMGYSNLILSKGVVYVSSHVFYVESRSTRCKGYPQSGLF